MLRNLPLLFAAILLLTSCPGGRTAQKSFPLKAGVLDLRPIGGDTFESMPIKGEAEFFWQKFILVDGDESRPTLLKYPEAWNLAGDYPAHGYGSYRIKVRLPQKMPISLRFDPIWSSSEIYLDGVLLQKRGIIGRRAADTQPNLGSGWIYSFTPEAADFTIVLHVANFDLFLGGAVSGIQIGPLDRIQADQTLIQTRGSFLLGALFIMGMYHISIFLLRHADKSSLYYGVFSLLVSLHIAAGDPSGALRLIIDPSFETTILLYNVSWMLATAAFCLYAHSLFPLEFSKKVARYVGYLSMAFVAFISLTHVRTFILMTQVYQLVMFGCILYSVFAMSLAAKRKREGSVAFVVCMAILMVCSVNDMLLMRGLVTSLPIGPAGVFIFTFGQSYLLSVRFARAFWALEVSDAEVRQLNENLEYRVQDKTKDIRAIMEHVPIGIFLVQGDEQTIDKDYSKFLENVVGAEDLAGRAMMPIVLENSSLSADELGSVRSALHASIGEVPLAFEANVHLLPTHVMLKNRHLHLSWNPMIDDHNLVRKVLVTLSDMTEVVQLEEDLKSTTQEMTLIGEIISIEVAAFERFMLSSKHMNAENWEVLKACRATLDMKSLKQIYINLHTMKGDARTIQLRSFSNFIHDVEKPFANALKSDALITMNAQMIEAHLQTIDDRLGRLEKIAYEKLNRKEMVLEKFHAIDTDELARIIPRLVDKPLEASDRVKLLAIHRSIEAHFLLPLHELMRNIFQSAAAVAEELGKNPPKSSIEVPHLLVGVRLQEVLRNVFVHLIRNSLDHGIEPPAERQGKGKDPTGRMDIRGRIQGSKLDLFVFDDGRGLHIGKLKLLAASTAYEYSDMDTLVEIIFRDGVSTAAHVNSISGRGVGMAAVRKFVEDLGGSIHILLTGSPVLGSDLTPFGFRILLPMDLFFFPLPADAGVS